MSLFINEQEYREAITAEKAVIGAMLIDPGVIPTAIQMLNKDDFLSASLADLFEKMVKLWHRTQTVDLVTLVTQIGETPENREYLIRLSEDTPCVTNVADYCRAVKEASYGRRAEEIVKTSDFRVRVGGDISERIKKTSEELANVIRDTSRRKGRTLQEVIRDIYVNDIFGSPNKNRIDTGIAGLDEILDGIYPKDLVTIAAGTSVGKTALMLNIILNIAKTGKKIALYSLEMSDKQNVHRVITKMTGVSLRKIKNGTGFTPKDADDLARIEEEMQDHSIMLYDESGIKVSDVRLDYMVDPDIDVIVIDHVGLMNAERSYSNRTEEVTQIAKDLKALAGSINKPIIMLCQFNRDGVQLKEPELWSLKDSGELEQSSSAVVLLWKLPEYENLEYSNKVGSRVIGVKVAKNRQGDVGRMALRFYPAHMNFVEIRDYDFKSPPTAKQPKKVFDDI